MRATWSALHASLCRHLNRSSSEVAFRMMRQIHPELAAFGSIAALMEQQQAPWGDQAASYGVIRALVYAAQSENSYRSAAHLMVLVALWPGLDAVFWRIARGFPDRRDDLPADVLARVGEAILAVDFARVTAVVATLLRNVERDIRRDLIADRVIGQASRPIDDPSIEAVVEAMVAPEPADDQVLADHLSGLRPEDAHLLRRVFTLGETQEEAGQSLGLSHDAARKRYQRALEKLRAQQKNPSDLSHSGAAIGL
ncbi:MAG TPA: sigma factor-like helix-turn-helix DNA-binding protein [Rhizobium sp.]|nr:sigma factor-like helix-turn-helix DNA-binding protein [Rhizobium sp.]